MNTKPTIFIGIDPDIENNGYAVWDRGDKTLEIGKKSFWDAIEDIELYNVPVKVIIEAGWLIAKSNWHGAKNKSTAAKIGKNVGSNHQVGRLFEEYCIKNNIQYQLVKPKGKIKADTFKRITGHTGRTNQDQRDAAMLVFGL